MISYLALGDSYTIGEGVALFDSFPYRISQQLRKNGIDCLPPEIHAKTGWTSDELLDSLESYSLLPSYDFVTLLIGVNNQYRGRSVESFLPDLEKLIKLALQKCNEKKDRLLVLSIPDWGQTPFAKGRDTKKISEEIDIYNEAIRSLCESRKLAYFDITSWPKENINAGNLVTSDQLHPSSEEYERWASMVVNHIKRTEII
jgi:lysophospholipase L1-like esterase